MYFVYIKKIHCEHLLSLDELFQCTHPTLLSFKINLEYNPVRVNIHIFLSKLPNVFFKLIIPLGNLFLLQHYFALPSFDFDGGFAVHFHTTEHHTTRIRDIKFPHKGGFTVLQRFWLFFLRFFPIQKSPQNYHF